MPSLNPAKWDINIQSDRIEGNLHDVVKAVVAVHLSTMLDGWPPVQPREIVRHLAASSLPAMELVAVIVGELHKRQQLVREREALELAGEN